MTDVRPRPDLDAARARVVERGLVAPAIAALTETVKNLPYEALAPVKQMLKQFFSERAWTERDDDKLAEIVGKGSGSERLALDPSLTLVWGWEANRFVLRVVDDETGVALSFEGDVVPQVTPSPRTIRFTTPPLHTGASRFYNSGADAVDDPRAARLFDDFDAVTNVLVGPDFVAVTIAHADQWAALLGPMLRAVTDAFTAAAVDGGAAQAREPASVPDARADTPPARGPRRLERAWAELGGLRASRPDDLERILAATSDAEPARRQVAAALLADAPPAAAAEAWSRLLADDSRAVRRSVVDAAVDAERDELRGLLERALTDADAWVRWKAVRGIAALGADPSRVAIERVAGDTDFRVRLEAARILG